MTKTAAPPGPLPKPAPASKPAESEKPKETMRDFVEQIVVAILLALLIRGFDAEAFVIPTGSMAPTLMGRHKEITCPQCGDVYAVNSSEEVEGNPNIPAQIRKDEASVCVNCRFPAEISDAPSFKGDRILVMKFPYEMPWLPGAGGPKRWDVVVFHYPEKPEQNYIKRLVGLPDEDLKIQRGDIYTKGASQAAFEIARKPESRLRAMTVLVNDDSHRPALLKGRPEWLRWKAAGGFKEGKEGVFAFDGDSKDAGGTLRYRHVVPDPDQWNEVWTKQPLHTAPRPTLITDFSSYNASTLSDLTNMQSAWLQSNWVGDLLLDFRLDVKSIRGGANVTVELIEGGVRNRCVIDPSTGTAALFHGPTKLGEAKTAIKGAGRHDVGFANADDRLTLWVDGRPVFGDGLAYDDGPAGSRGPTAADLDPAGISIEGASAEVSGLVLKRDIYYTRDPRNPDFRIPDPSSTFESARRKGLKFLRVDEMFDALADPEKFGPWLADAEPGETYTIRPDNFMMLGDNSPRSSDGRAWGRQDRDWDDNRTRHEVPRTMLIGKAFYVYWPHGVPFWFDIRLSHDFRIPFRPYFERMRPIR